MTYALFGRPDFDDLDYIHQISGSLHDADFIRCLGFLADHPVPSTSMINDYRPYLRCTLEQSPINALLSQDVFDYQVVARHGGVSGHCENLLGLLFPEREFSGSEETKPGPGQIWSHQRQLDFSVRNLFEAIHWVEAVSGDICLSSSLQDALSVFKRTATGLPSSSWSTSQSSALLSAINLVADGFADAACQGGGGYSDRIVSEFMAVASYGKNLGSYFRLAVVRLTGQGANCSFSSDQASTTPAAVLPVCSKSVQSVQLNSGDVLGPVCGSDL